MFDNFVIVKRNYLSKFLGYLGIDKQQFQQGIVLVTRVAATVVIRLIFL